MLKVLPFVFLTSALSLAAAEPVLQNPGFDQKLAPWTCEEGKVIPDPEKKDNTIFEVTLDGGVFGLSQTIKWPADQKKLTLSFRIKASQATEKSPVQWRLRIYDKAENSALAAGAKITRSGEWITIKQEIERPESEPVSLMLESNRGEGKLWIDDLTLE